MTCYEILTRRFPFEGHIWNNYDLVLNGGRPKVPKYVDDWAHGLLNWCWHPNANDRPSFGDVLKFLSVNSKRIRKYNEERGI
jgi:hypothetical protein